MTDHQDHLVAPRNTFCGQTRREFLWEAGGSFTSVALASMLATDGFLTSQALAADGKSIVRRASGTSTFHGHAGGPRP